jgi:hypothetical protein
MSPAQPVMVARIVEVEEIRLRNGKRFVSVRLDKSHVDVLRFQATLPNNRPASARKRRKSGLPEDTFYNVETWLVPPGAVPRQVTGASGFFKSATEPARFSLSDLTAADVPVGSVLELRVGASSRVVK